MSIDVIFDETIFLLEKVREKHTGTIRQLAERLHAVFGAGNKIMICGNGGSAADAQHMAAEFVNRFKIERESLPGMALTTDTSVLTSIGNDYSYDDIFAKQVRALGKKGDMLLGISTSGRSKNVLAAFSAARDRGIITAGLSGDHTPEMADLCDIYIPVPSRNTPRVQEVHLLIEHVVCELIDEFWRRDHVPAH